MRHYTLLSAGALLFLVGGCGDDLAYRGVSPSLRTFADRPELADYYVGMNMRFAVLDPEDQKRLALDRQAQLAAGRTPAEVRKSQIERDKEPGLQPDSPSQVPPPDVPQ
ncbi:MAG TPA: hypothetical protein VEA69_04810 [Tepidisphaeraceae bacterium]|nr:hypothetical protein [Tepidisphaeraceae bacterium]